MTGCLHGHTHTVAHTHAHNHKHLPRGRPWRHAQHCGAAVGRVCHVVSHKSVRVHDAGILITPEHVCALAGAGRLPGACTRSMTHDCMCTACGQRHVQDARVVTSSLTALYVSHAIGPRRRKHVRGSVHKCSRRQGRPKNSRPSYYQPHTAHSTQHTAHSTQHRVQYAGHIKQNSTRQKVR